MSKLETVWMLYAVNSERTAGFSHSFQDEDDAEAMALYLRSKDWEVRHIQQQYELEEDSYHDCGDGE